MNVMLRIKYTSIAIYDNRKLYDCQIFFLKSPYYETKQIEKFVDLTITNFSKLKFTKQKKLKLFMCLDNFTLKKTQSHLCCFDLDL